MLFFPYKADLDLQRIPVISMMICLLCVAVFFAQINSAGKAEQGIQKFCDDNTELSFRLSLESVMGSGKPSACRELFESHFYTYDGDVPLNELLDSATQLSGFTKKDSRNYVENILKSKIHGFNSLGLNDLTNDLAYFPRSYDVPDMFYSSVAHGDWMHLAGNLLFFFAFAATVELMLGYGRYILFLIILAVGIGLSYSLFTMNDPIAYPTIGLSGVVMGMIGVFAYLMPTVKVRCFIWFIIFFRFISIPAWLLASWYIGWDVYNVLHNAETSNINFVAHLSGALIGVLFGSIFLRKEKRSFALDGEI